MGILTFTDIILNTENVSEPNKIGINYKQYHLNILSVIQSSKMLHNANRLSNILGRHISLFHRSNKHFEIKTNNDFVSKVINGSVPVVVNFHAEWCNPCKTLTPKLIELIEPMDKLDLAVVNVESNPELTDIFEVKGVPAVVVISNGLVVDKFIGSVDTKMIEKLIDKLTNGPVDTKNGKTEV